MTTTVLPQSFSIIDTTAAVLTGDILFPFALDEILCRQVGNGEKEPVIHLWRHQKAFVLGLRDRKLPHSEQAMDELAAEGFAVSVRNSGGAAVPLDPGVINMSIILPNPGQRMDFHQDFEIMYEVIKASLRSYGTVEKGEITGAYCPGDYDLSIEGKKFCGIAQRRQTKAFVIQAFIVVEGNGEERANLVKRFYRTASQDNRDLKFPEVTPERMASLQELSGIQSAAKFLEHLVHWLIESGGRIVQPEEWIHPVEKEIEQMIDQLRVRYEKR